MQKKQSAVAKSGFSRVFARKQKAVAEIVFPQAFVRRQKAVSQVFARKQKAVAEGIFSQVFCNSKKAVFVILFVVLVSVIQLAPTLAGYFAATDRIYLGFESPEDSFVYASFVEDAQKNVLLENKQAIEPQLRRYFLPLFSVMAAVSNLGFSIPHAFLLFRFFEIVFFLLALWVLLGLVFPDFGERFFSLAFLSFAGGLGWLVAAIGQFIPLIARIKSTDLSFWLGYSLVGNMYVPHRYWALGLALLGFFLFLIYRKRGKVVLLAATAFLAPAIFFIHPVTAIFYSITIGLMQLFTVFQEQKISRKTLLPIFFFVISMLPALLYSVWASQDPLIQQHQKIYFFVQKIEPLLFYSTGFGIVLGLALLGLFSVLKKMKHLEVEKLLFAWLVSAFALTRFGFGVEYLVFLAVILGIMAVRFLLSVRAKIPAWAFAITILFCVLSAPLVLLERAQRTAENPIAFVTPAENEAMNELGFQPPGIVFSSQRIGQIASWRTPHKPVVGQGYLTPNKNEKAEDVARFFERPSLEILQKYQPDFVWLEASKKQWAESEAKTLSLFFSNSEVLIYRYTKNKE